MMQSPGLAIVAVRPQASDAVSQSLNFLMSKVRVISHASPNQEAWMRCLQRAVSCAAGASRCLVEVGTSLSYQLYCPHAWPQSPQQWKALSWEVGSVPWPAFRQSLNFHTWVLRKGWLIRAFLVARASIEPPVAGRTLQGGCPLGRRGAAEVVGSRGHPCSSDLPSTST